VINPPFGLHAELEMALPVLTHALGQDARASGRVRSGSTPADIKTALGMSTPSAVSPTPRHGRGKPV